MIIKSTLPLFFSSLVCGEVSINVDLNEEGYPCIIGSFSDELGIRERCLRVDPGSESVWIRQAPSSTDLIVRTISDDEFRLTNLRVLSSSLSDENGSIGIGFGSDIEQFSQRSVMLIPGQMILDPVHPLLFCQDRAMGTLAVRRNHRGANMQDYPTTISLVSQVDGSLYQIGRMSPSMAQSGFLQLSFEKTVITQLAYTTIEAAYNHLTRGALLDTPGIVCSSIMSQLPAIKFSISNPRGDTSTQINLLLYPEDYLQIEPETGFCSSKIQPSRRASDLELGYGVIQNMGIHLDYANNQIGFCEPI